MREGRLWGHWVWNEGPWMVIQKKEKKKTETYCRCMSRIFRPKRSPQDVPPSIPDSSYACPCVQ